MKLQKHLNSVGWLTIDKPMSSMILTLRSSHGSNVKNHRLKTKLRNLDRQKSRQLLPPNKGNPLVRSLRVEAERGLDGDTVERVQLHLLVLLLQLLQFLQRMLNLGPRIYTNLRLAAIFVENLDTTSETVPESLQKIKF